MPLTGEEARRFYDRLGLALDRAERFESLAKARGIERLAPRAGERIVELGVGTGHVTERLLAAVGRSGRVVGIDIAPRMLEITRRRAEAAGLAAGLELVEAPASRVPLAEGWADGVYSSYLLDLLPEPEVREVLCEALRILRPGGRAVFVGMTRPVGLAARALMGVWRVVSALAPKLTGGCRALELLPFLVQAGFDVASRETIEQAGLPSEVLLARKR